MRHFLVSMVESSSEISHSAFNSTGNGHAMLHRLEIDDGVAEISHLCRFSARSQYTWLVPMFLAKVVPFDEIAAYRSDPRHVTELMSLSGGLGVAITAGTHGCDVF